MIFEQRNIVCLCSVDTCTVYFGLIHKIQFKLLLMVLFITTMVFYSTCISNSSQPSTELDRFRWCLLNIYLFVDALFVLHKKSDVVYIFYTV